MLNKFFAVAFGVLVLALPSEAFAFRANHKGMTEMRPLLGGDAYVSQQVQYSQTRTQLQGSGDSIKTTLVQGYTLRAAVGFEHNRLLQTGVFFASNTDRMNGGTHAEFRSMEVGGEAKLVFTGPIANLCVGGGYSANQGSFRDGVEFATTSGTGYFGVAEVVYFISSRMSLNASFSSTWSQGYARGGSFNRMAGEGLRAGAGIAIWM